MTKGDIYIGSVKLCINKNNYEAYGEKQKVDKKSVGNFNEYGVIAHVLCIDNKAPLVKINDNCYAWLNNFGKIQYLNSKPNEDGKLFVDENSLTNYYEDELDLKINSKILRYEINR